MGTSNPVKKEPKQRRHARFQHPGVPYHIISKTIRGEFLLAPKKDVERICLGIVAKAQDNWPKVKLYAAAFMSNHIHMMASGPSCDLSEFVGLIKREISRRLGQKYNLPGPFWDSRFTSTALPTIESQESCLAYILSQGVKENLVEDPTQWPGLHCAKAMARKKPLVGAWFNATKYHNAVRQQKVAKSPKCKRVRKSEFYQEMEIQFTPIPSWSTLTKTEQIQKAKRLIAKIVAAAKAKRKTTHVRVLGLKAIRRIPISKRSSPKPPPWWQKRRRQITAWAKLSDKITQQYLQLYWTFQAEFRIASVQLKNGSKSIFPRNAWAPARYLPA